MPIVASSFIYPWDLADMGVEEALRRFKDEGFQALDLTTSYHPITAFTPGAPGRRILDTNLGGIFFPARMERYGRIKPRLYRDRDVLAAWPRASEMATRFDLKLTAWTVCLYQPWIAKAYPDTARHLPTGQRNNAGVCASSEDVQEFLATLVADVASQFPLEAVQLEGVTSPNFDAGWRAGFGSRVLVEVGPWSRRLLSLCFCPSCVRNAQKAGVQVDSLRRRVNDELRAAYEAGEPASEPSAKEGHVRRLETDPDYAQYIMMRDQASVRLVNRIADAIDEVRPSTSLGIWGPNEWDGTRLDLDRVLSRIGILQCRQPLIEPENAREARALADANPGLRIKTINFCGGFVGTTFGPKFEAALDASVKLPTDIVNVFSWPMLSPKIAARIVPLLRRLERSSGVSVSR